MCPQTRRCRRRSLTAFSAFAALLALGPPCLAQAERGPRGNLPASRPASEPDTDQERRLRDLREELTVARARGEQQAACARLLELCRLEPANHAWTYALGEAYASFGPAFDKALAIQRLRMVLDRVTAASWPALQHELRMLGVAGAALPLPAFRLLVRRQLADLDAGRRLLLAPDRRALERAASDLDKRIAVAKRTIAQARAEIARHNREVKACMTKLERDQQPHGGNVGGLDSDHIMDQVERHRRAIKKLERDIETTDKDLAACKDCERGYRQRLKAFH